MTRKPRRAGVSRLLSTTETKLRTKSFRKSCPVYTIDVWNRRQYEGSDVMWLAFLRGVLKVGKGPHMTLFRRCQTGDSSILVDVRSTRLDMSSISNRYGNRVILGSTKSMSMFSIVEVHPRRRGVFEMFFPRGAPSKNFHPKGTPVITVRGYPDGSWEW